MNGFGIYIHIPFCVRKCAYCDFLSFPANKTATAQYTQTLLKECDQKADIIGRRDITSIFIGGGTPSILEAQDIKLIIAKIREHGHVLENAEITIEANPGTITPEKLETYRKAGINRISFGVQSANDAELKALGRIHCYSEAEAAFAMAKAAGFTNLNADVMFGLPGQTVESYRHTLDSIAALGTTHISAYSLIIEEGTPFFKLYGEAERESKEALPSEEEEREMYELTKEFLAERGYAQYEISNYAKEGYESRHNKLYWERDEYVGLGLGASSYLRARTGYATGDGNAPIQEEAFGIRYKNPSDMREYAAGVLEKLPEYEETEVICKSDAMSEFMFLGLREMKGVSRNTFANEFACTIDDVFGTVIKKYVDLGLLSSEGDSVKLTEEGVGVSNVVFADLLLEPS